MTKAIIRQNSPIAPDRAKPGMAKEKNCCFNRRFLVFLNTDPIPAPKPATPTVAAIAPINLQQCQCFFNWSGLNVANCHASCHNSSSGSLDATS